MKRAAVMAVAASLFGSGCSDLLGLDFDGYRAETAASSTGGAGGGPTTSSTGGAGNEGGVGGAGGCSASQLACDGACRDPSSDGEHCGACDHDCFGGACFSGVCQAVAVATGQVGPTGIAAANGALYWLTDGGDVMRLDLSGSAPAASLIDHGDAGLHGLATDGIQLFYTATFANEIRRIELDGSDAVALKTGALEPVDIAIGGPYVFWTKLDGANSELHKTPKAGGGGASFIVKQAALGGLAADDMNFYFTICDAGGAIYRRDHGVGGNASVGNDQDHPCEVRVWGSMAYWANSGGGEVRRAPTGGGEAADVAVGQLGPRALHVDEDGVYWANADAGTIASAPHDGSRFPAVLAAGQSETQALTSDATSIYWTNHTGGEVMRLAKPPRAE